MSKLWRFPGGLHLDGHKKPSCEVPITPARIPEILVLPLQQHIGVPATPVVKVGERVRTGQILGHCGDRGCGAPGVVPIHASSSGTVVAIEPRPVPHPSGLKAECVVIETDGKDEWIELHPLLEDCTDVSADNLRMRIAQAGIVGLGGAGFPSHIKLLPRNIELLILNGAECEPYITCDDRLMRDRPEETVMGAKILSHVLGGAKRCIIAVEDNKPQAFAALKAHLKDEPARDRLGGFKVEVMKVPTLYPTGGERQLIHVLTGKEVPQGQFPSHIGMVVHNVETAARVYRAVKFGEPLVSRIVTFTGSALEKPQNLEVRLGTPVQSLLEQCGLKEMPAHLVMGGPMMGFSLTDSGLPIIKTTNCVIALSEKELLPPPPIMPCIRCGACEQVCPVSLLPQQLYWYARAKNFGHAEDHHIFDCIECGCCSHVCPSRIPLVQYYRYAKAEIRARRKDLERAEAARQRHEFRTFRLEREKTERKAKHAVAAKTDVSDADKQAAIAAAVERIKAKQAERQTLSNDSTE